MRLQFFSYDFTCSLTSSLSIFSNKTDALRWTFNPWQSSWISSTRRRFIVSVETVITYTTRVTWFPRTEACSRNILRVNGTSRKSYHIANFVKQSQKIASRLSDRCRSKITLMEVELRKFPRWNSHCWVPYWFPGWNKISFRNSFLYSYLLPVGFYQLRDSNLLKV